MGLLMSSNAAHPMRPATRLNAPPPMKRNALVVMEDMDTARIARRFPIKAARVSQSRHHPNSAPKCQRKTANRFQSKFQNRIANRYQRRTVSKFPNRTVIKFPRRFASRCLFRHQQKFQDKFVRNKDMDMVTK